MIFGDIFSFFRVFATVSAEVTGSNITWHHICFFWAKIFGMFFFSIKFKYKVFSIKLMHKDAFSHSWHGNLLKIAISVLEKKPISPLLQVIYAQHLQGMCKIKLNSTTRKWRSSSYTNVLAYANLWLGFKIASPSSVENRVNTSKLKLLEGK